MTYQEYLAHKQQQQQQQQQQHKHDNGAAGTQHSHETAAAAADGGAPAKRVPWNKGRKHSARASAQQRSHAAAHVACMQHAPACNSATLQRHNMGARARVCVRAATRLRCAVTIARITAATAAAMQRPEVRAKVDAWNRSRVGVALPDEHRVRACARVCACGRVWPRTSWLAVQQQQARRFPRAE
jgi:hypothetical protein